MEKQTFINGKDIHTEYNAELVGDSVESLLHPAALKEMPENDFRTQNGKQVFFIEPRDAERDITLEFKILATSQVDYVARQNALVAELKKGIATIYCAPIDTTVRVMLNAFMSLGYHQTFGVLSVKVTEVTEFSI